MTIGYPEDCGCETCRVEAREVDALGVAVLAPPTLIRVTQSLIDAHNAAERRDFACNAITEAIREHVRPGVKVLLRGPYAWFEIRGERASVKLPYVAILLWRQLWQFWPADELTFPLEIPERFLRS